MHATVGLSDPTEYQSKLETFDEKTKPNSNVEEHNHRETRPGTVERKKLKPSAYGRNPRDTTRNRREEGKRISRLAGAVQRQLALDRQPSLSAAVPEAYPSTISLVAIMEARSAKFMRDIAS